MELPNSGDAPTDQPTEKKSSRVSSENSPQIEMMTCPKGHTKTEQVSILTDVTSTGPEDANTETDDTNTETVDANGNTADTNAKSDDTDAETDDASRGRDDVSAGTDDSVYDVAPEGGWGWMVTLAGFVVAFIVDGMVSTFGLMLPELMATFGVGMSLTSLPPAILVAMYLLSGPMTGYLVKKWGCRLVGFCGGLLAALGVGVSAYAANIYIFILGFGLITGMGCGLIYLPSVIMVNMYFHKKRGMVAGIITSGSGFGLLALAPLTEMLMEQYGWRGCYLIMAAIALHFWVCASLMRPLPRPPPSSLRSSQTLEGVEVGVEGEDSWSLVSVQELEVYGKGDHSSRGAQLDGEGQSENLLHKIHLAENGISSHFHDKTRQEENGELFHLAQHRPHHSSLLSSVRNLFLSSHRSHVLSGAGTTGPTDSALLRSRSHGHLECRPSHRPHTPLPGNVLSTWLACQLPPSLSHHTLPSQQSSDNMAGQRGGSEQQRWNEGCHLATSGTKVQNNKIAWGQSLPSMHHSQDIVVLKNQLKVNPGYSHISCKASAEEIHAEPAVSYTLVPCGGPPPCSHDSSAPEPEKGRCVGGWVRERRVFTCFLMGAFLIQLACSVPPLLAPSFAYQHGVSKEHVATILAVYGLMNTAGRLLAGVLVYWGVRTLHVHNVSTLLSAVACFTLPLSTSFPSIAVSLGLHGFFLGAFPPLQPVILVEYLGLDRLTSTFGTMCLVKAFASAAGAPLAGMLFTVTGTYTVPLAVCGAVLVMAAILHQLMDCWP